MDPALGGQGVPSSLWASPPCDGAAEGHVSSQRSGSRGECVLRVAFCGLCCPWTLWDKSCVVGRADGGRPCGERGEAAFQRQRRAPSPWAEPGPAVGAWLGPGGDGLASDCPPRVAVSPRDCRPSPGAAGWFELIDMSLRGSFSANITQLSLTRSVLQTGIFSCCRVDQSRSQLCLQHHSLRSARECCRLLFWFRGRPHETKRVSRTEILKCISRLSVSGSAWTLAGAGCPVQIAGPRDGSLGRD